MEGRADPFLSRVGIVRSLASRNTLKKGAVRSRQVDRSADFKFWKLFWGQLPKVCVSHRSAVVSQTSRSTCV